MNELKKTILSTGIKQSELAEIVGWSDSKLSNKVTGYRGISGRDVFILIDGFASLGHLVSYEQIIGKASNDE